MKHTVADDIVEFGTGFDWITPLLSIFGGWPGITVHRDTQVTVDAAMASCNIQQRHRKLVGDAYCFCVPPGRYDDALEAIKTVGA